ncbi:MAG: hypothetical protein WC881_00165 [Elusimicrobiota bacterium]
MAKLYPDSVLLKKLKCPDCGQSLDDVELRQVDSVVRADCGSSGCTYSLELFWLGQTTVSTN